LLKKEQEVEVAFSADRLKEGLEVTSITSSEFVILLQELHFKKVQAENFQKTNFKKSLMQIN